MSARESVAAFAARIGIRQLTLREVLVDANDGIIATAGIIEGLSGADVVGSSLVVASVLAVFAGALALAVSAYSGAAADRDDFVAAVAEERRQLALAPEAEAAELVAYLETRGLSAALARQVAEELGQRDPLAAHVAAEHGFSLHEGPDRPLSVAITAGLGFTAGASVPVVTAILTSDTWRGFVTLLAVVVSLTVTSVVQARAEGTPVWRTVLRTVVVGMSAITLTYLAGSAFERH